MSRILFIAPWWKASSFNRLLAVTFLVSKQCIKGKRNIDAVFGLEVDITGTEEMTEYSHEGFLNELGQL